VLCPACSREVPETAKVCGYCGVRLAAKAEQQSPVGREPERATPETEDGTRPGRSRRGLRRGLIVAALCLAAIGAAAAAVVMLLPKGNDEGESATTVAQPTTVPTATSDASTTSAAAASTSTLTTVEPPSLVGMALEDAQAAATAAGFAVLLVGTEEVPCGDPSAGTVIHQSFDPASATIGVNQALADCSALTDQGIPAMVGSILADPTVTYRATFDSSLAGWDYDASLVTFSDGTAVFEGADWYPRLERSEGLTGRAALFGFRSASDVFNLMLQVGVWEDSGFRRWGLVIGQGFTDVETFEGTARRAQSLGVNLADGDKSFALLGHDDRLFFVYVWGEGQEQPVSYAESLGEGWLTDLRGMVEVPGGTVYLEDYLEFQFGDYIGTGP